MPNMYGDNIWQGPLWIRPGALMAVRVEPYTHIVGHTRTKRIDLKWKGQLILTDCLDTVNEYLVIEDKEVEVKKL